MTAEARIVPVILCGGAGTRLWPSSRESYPKQFLPLLGDRSTFEDTLARISDRSVFADPMIVTAEGFRFLVADQMTRSNVSGKLVLEPMRRDSGPAIAVAAELAHALDPSTVMLVLAADHVVMDHAAFVATAKAGLAAAQKGAIVTFGVVPSHPATGYGYIQPGETIADNVRAVANFIEKPDLERAEKLVADGFLWNSGNFMFRADAFLAELARFQPAMAEACRKAAEGVVPETVSNLTFLRMDAEAFASSPAKSVDYAVMELTDRAAVVNAPYDWSDLGSWDALWQIAPKDENGNVTRGNTFTVDANNCLIDGEGIAAAVVGLDNIAVITTKDAVLVARRDVAGQMKTLHALVASSHRKLVDEHIRMYRPWGWYQQVDIGERFQVKRLHVTPGKRLSLQKHYHRSEHWTVVKGTATVTLGEETRTVHENESVYLPIGIWHRLANDGKIPLEIIEVQTGSYLGEDDIVRTEDDFKRS